MLALQKLKFVVLLLYLLIKKNCQILTYQLGKTGHNQPCKDRRKNDPLCVNVGCKVTKLWPRKVCQHPG